MDDYIILIVIFLLECLLFYYMPTFNGRNTLFGLVLKEDFQSDGVLLLKNYRRNLIFIFALFLAAVFLSVRYSPQSLVFTYIFAVFAQIFLMFVYFRKAWKIRGEKPLTKIAAILKDRRLSDFTKVWLEIAVVLSVISTFLILAFYYSQLPDIVPIHWNWKGEPDGWEKKGFFSVFLLPVILLLVQTFLLMLKKDIVQARFRVPAENAETIAAFKENSLQINMALLDWIRLMTGVLLSSISLQILTAISSFAFSNELSILHWTSLILLLAGGGFYIYQLISINREIKNLAGRINFQTASETEKWNGGIFYYNKNDAAFVVEKPTGLGYTFNFAHKKIWLYALIIFLPEILILANLALMEKL